MRMPFGKHKGRLLEEIDTGYLQWLYYKADFVKPYLRIAVGEELDRREGEELDRRMDLVRLRVLELVKAWNRWHENGLPAQGDEGAAFVYMLGKLAEVFGFDDATLGVWTDNPQPRQPDFYLRSTN